MTIFQDYRDALSVAHPRGWANTPEGRRALYDWTERFCYGRWSHLTGFGYMRRVAVLARIAGRLS